jgi:hypothetical protein
MRSVIVDLLQRPNQVEFAAPGGISGDGEESMVNYPQKIGNQCGSEVKSTWSKVWLGGHDDEYKRSKSGKSGKAK